MTFSIHWHLCLFVLDSTTGSALLCINQRLYKLTRQTTEAYLATIPDAKLIHLEAAAGALITSNYENRAKDPEMVNFERLSEIYVVHVLAKLGD